MFWMCSVFFRPETTTPSQCYGCVSKACPFPQLAGLCWPVYMSESNTCYFCTNHCLSCVVLLFLSKWLDSCDVCHKTEPLCVFRPLWCRPLWIPPCHCTQQPWWLSRWASCHWETLERWVEFWDIFHLSCTHTHSTNQMKSVLPLNSTLEAIMIMIATLCTDICELARWNLYFWLLPAVV